MGLFPFLDSTYTPWEFLVFWGPFCEILRFSCILFLPFWNRRLKNIIINKRINSSLQRNFAFPFWHANNVTSRTKIINIGKDKTFYVQCSMRVCHKCYLISYSMRYILRNRKWNKKVCLAKGNAFKKIICKHFG